MELVLGWVAGLGLLAAHESLGRLCDREQKKWTANCRWRQKATPLGSTRSPWSTFCPNRVVASLGFWTSEVRLKFRPWLVREKWGD